MHIVYCLTSRNSIWRGYGAVFYLFIRNLSLCKLFLYIVDHNYTDSAPLQDYLCDHQKRKAMDSESICLNLRRIRESLNLSITKMADELDMTRVAYNNVEKGKTRMVSPTIYKIAKFTGLPPEEVLLGRMAQVNEGQMLNDLRNNYKTRIDMMVNDYEDRLETQRAMIKEKDTTIKAQEETIHALQSMIAYLQKEK